MSNDNYISAVGGFDVDNYYEAASIGAFNQQTASCCAAFVLFFMDGSYQQLNTTLAPAQFLWGNLDNTPSGWAFLVQTIGGVPTLLAAYGTGIASAALTADLSKHAFTERLIHAGLWVTDTGIALSINGTIVSQAAPVVVAPSSAAPRVGLTVDDLAQLQFGYVVACGYDANTARLLDGNDRAAGTLAGSSFVAARASYRGGQLFSSLDIDWLHRYEVASLGQGFVGTLQQNSTGQARSIPKTPTGPLPDVGNTSFTPANVPPVALNRVADGSNAPVLISMKNPDWYVSDGFVFTAPEEPG